MATTTANDRLLESLNEPQRAAVLHGDGPLLVLAGAGSGKTRVLTHRIAHLVESGQAMPGEILAITFTNKAAQEMRERVELLVGGRVRAMWVLTFHSACARMLRAEAPRLGYTRGFTIYDQADSRRLIKRCLDELGIDPKRFSPAAVHAQISDAKNRLRDADAYRQLVGSYFEQTVADVYREYERQLHRMNAMDFDDLLVRAVNVLELFPEVREGYATGFRDEVDTDGFGTVFTPSGERTVSGSFAQIKTDYAGFLETITAVRYDKYSLQGGGFYSDGDRVSPKVTIGLTAIRGITPYVIYAEGYRAPAVTEAFIDGIHPSPPNFTLLPNPQLRPEVGKNEELGVNLRYNDVLRLGDQFRAKFNIYRNHVENYIDLRPLAFGQRGQSGLTCQNRLVFFCYQYQNIQDARLSGMEFETYYDAGSWFAGLAGTHGVWGRDVTNNLPLATIPPDQVTTTLGRAVPGPAVDGRGALAVGEGQEPQRHSARRRSTDGSSDRASLLLLSDVELQPDQHLCGLSDQS